MRYGIIDIDLYGGYIIMKFNKKTISISILLIVLTITVISIKNISYSFADEINSNNIKYSIINNEVMITGYSGDDEVLYVPNKIQGYNVTAIGEDAFYNCSKLESIEIPNSVKTIGDNAFYNCSNLKSITIPNGVKTIRYETFKNCSNLESIEIPNSVTTIEHRAFYNCSNLKSITIPNGVTTINEYIFYNCSSLESVTIPNSVTEIRSGVFSYCSSLESIEIPNSVIHIYSDAFDNNVTFYVNWNSYARSYAQQHNLKFYAIDDINSHWAKNTIKDFISKGYINGYQDGSFKPNNDITRAEFVKIANRVFGFTEKGTVTFNDVRSSDWFYNEIAIAQKAGYINGKSSTTFAPNDKITRQEVAVILTNIKNNKDTNYDKLNKFTDGYKTSEWAKSSVEGAIEAGYLNGNDKGLLNPISNITRAEAVTMLSRVKK